MVAVEQELVRPLPRWPLLFAGVLLMLELGAIGVIFKHSISFNCQANWPLWACSGASGTLIAVYCILGALVLMTMLRPAPFRALLAQAGSARWPLLINALGVLITLVPILFLKEGSGSASLAPAFGFWFLGMSAVAAGLALFAAPMARWRTFFGETWSTMLPVILIGAATPYLSTLIRPIWKLDTIADVTFSAVVSIIGAMGYAIDSLPEDKIIGAGDFYIQVANVCSGIEGIALVTLFVSLYLWLFRSELRFPLALLLYPLGILTSAIFNVFRITILLIIGLEGNPELAVGGFHSHAGWLMFTLVALGIVTLAQTVPVLQKNSVSAVAEDAGVQAPTPLLKDPMVARILPFAVFMLSALPATALVSVPGVVYPIRVVLMAAVLALFWQIYRALPWRMDLTATAVGLAIGLMWVLIPVETSNYAPYGALTGGLLVLWFILRGIGTIVLVPVIEELFFRDYLEQRLRFGTGFAWRVLAAFVTAGLFAALHDRWAEAFVAGLAFSWVMQRRGNVTDAIVAHAAANALVFAVAVISGNLAII